MIDYDKNALNEMLLALLHVIKESDNVKKIPTRIPKKFFKELEAESLGTLSKNGEHFELTEYGEIEAEEFYEIFLNPESTDIQNEIAKGIFESMNELLLDKPEIVTEENTKKVFTLKIELKHLKPPVWRRIKIPGHLSLNDLKDIIFLMFGWTSSHLYAFTINNYEFPESTMDFLEIDDPLDPEDDLEDYQLSGTIGDVKKFTFTYDFGENWEHNIKIEKVEEIENFSTPEVLKVVRESPMEDVGGPFMVQHIKSVLSDKKHPEYKEISETYGEFMDSILPDKDELNKVLKSKYPGGNLRIVK